MFISKKKFDQAIAEAVEKGRMEADKGHWEMREHAELRDLIHRLGERVEALENKGKKRRFGCRCHEAVRPYL